MKKIFSRVLFLGLVSSIGFMSSCEKEYFVPVPPEPIDTSMTPDTASYSLEIQPYFDASCVSCHGGVIAPNLSSAVSWAELHDGGYIDLVTPSNSLLYTKIHVGGSMEQYSTSADTKNVLQWITEGAKNN